MKPRHSLAEIAVVFTRLGFTAFGGPAAHVAMIEEEVVGRRGWIDRQHFLDLVGAINFIPGPNSTELAICLGLMRGGVAGMIVSGFCFITPAVLIILPVAWAYVRFGATVPQVSGAMHGIGAAVVAIVAAAGWRFARTAIRDRFLLVLSAATVGGEYLLRRSGAVSPGMVPLALVAAAGAAGIAWYVRPTGLNATVWLVQLGKNASERGRGPPGSAAPKLRTAAERSLAALAVAGAFGTVALLAGFFLKVGATLFGSGYVLASYLQAGLVDRADPWLTQRQLLDAIAVGQVTPGPLLTTSTFIGYLRGHALFGTTVGGVFGAIVATVSIFLPGFVFVGFLARLLPRLRANRAARAALDGINAAVVALIFVAAWRFALALWPDRLRLALAGACLIVLLVRNINATWLIVACALITLAAQVLIQS